jgi:hypothetical protein
MTVLVTKPAVNIREALASLNEPQAISDVFGLQPALDAKQPLDADLTAIAALSSADGNIIVGSVSGWVAESGDTARTSLGLGTGDSPTFAGVTATTVNATTVDATTAQADGVEITSASGDIDMLWASGSVHRVGSAYGGTYFTGMRVSADTRNVDLISLDASGLGNFRVFTGTSEVERLSINPSGTAAFSGNITVSGTVDTRDIATDGAKLDGIEAGADVTDTANVEAAGAVMDGDFTADGFMKRTGAGSYTVDTSTYLTEVAALNDIGDVTITGTPADNELLAYDTTTGAFINQTASEAGVQPYNSALDTYVTYALSAFELAQLGNIDSYSITGTHWSIVSGLNQNLSTTDSPVFNTATLGANSTVGAIKIGYRNIPQVTKSASYTLTTSDVGKHINVDTVGANITIPDATFSAGDVVSVVNNTANDAYMPCSITSGYIAGVNANKNGTNFTIPTRGIATILFLSSTVCVVSGNVS